MQKEITDTSIMTTCITTSITAETIRMARSRLGYSQIQLANKSYLFQSMISRIEREEFSLDTLMVNEPHRYLNLLKALELDKIAIQIVELGQTLGLSEDLTRETLS